MAKYRVFIEAVKDPEDPVLIKRLATLSKKDEQVVMVLLDSLPAILCEGIEKQAAESLKEYLEPVGARVMLKEMRDSEGEPKHKDSDDSILALDDSLLAEQPAGLSFFQRLSWGFEIFGQTWGRQLLLLLAVVGIGLIAELLLTGLMGNSLAGSIDPNDPLSGLVFLSSPGFLVGMVLFQLVMMLAGFWYQASIIRLVAAFMEDGGTATLGAVMGHAWRRVPELITAVGLVMLPLFLGFGAISLGGSALLLPDSPGVLAFLVLAASILMLGLSVALALTGPVAVLESIGPWQAVKRAWTLSQGWRWRLFGNLLLLIVGMFLFLLVMQLLFALVLPQAMLGDGIGQTGGLGLSLGLVLFIVLFVAFYLLAMFLFVFMLTAFYFEARVISEGWAPCWAIVPDPSWPIDDADPEPARDRGLRGWLELAGYTLVGLLLLWGGLAYMGDRLSDMAKEMQTGEQSILDSEPWRQPPDPGDPPRVSN